MAVAFWIAAISHELQRHIRRFLELSVKRVLCRLRFTDPVPVMEAVWVIQRLSQSFISRTDASARHFE